MCISLGKSQGPWNHEPSLIWYLRYICTAPTLFFMSQFGDSSQDKDNLEFPLMPNYALYMYNTFLYRDGQNTHKHLHRSRFAYIDPDLDLRMICGSGFRFRCTQNEEICVYNKNFRIVFLTWIRICIECQCWIQIS